MYLTGWTVALAALGAVPAALSQSRGVAFAWMLGVALLALLDAWLAPRTATVGVRREAPASVRLTEPTSTRLVAGHVGGRRRVRGVLRDAWQPSAGAARTRHRFDLGPGEAATFATAMRPTRRGDRHAGPVTIRTAGPLRLAGRQRSVEVPARLRVLPEFASRKHLPSRLKRLREIDGSTAVRLKGAGSEFDSMREYVIGDDVRAIDWRSTARRGEVLVRTFRPERDRRVLIAIDCARQSAARVGDAPRLDASIEAALLLAALASRAGDRVQATAFDRSERARAAATGEQIMPLLAEALATVEPSLLEPDWPALLRLAQSRVSQRALVVLLTTVDTSATDSGLLDAVAALQRHHQVLVASVEDPEVAEMAAGRDDAAAAYAAGAAARALLEREAVAAQLRRLGAEVVLAAPDSLAPDVTDRYLALKAAGRL
ncbi:DUF58 domain-containing protein [Demequina sp. SYSU T00039]|uniref:DUF58 domain-containing protein n=1 Tax=Demequina lignilytica TaxID=3051663 RepID=A0AAW7M3U0_9MICO|nr:MULTISPECIES: DUF58 domain-containing protein [unclassified Demequina]MDN4478273.1 DUF58 domain-containing protein [Demequina sp. SYSU T00039-1]MDN4488277.1 DUF58 domain-containing protein [Demequina sp. SYSU T00039]MDN4490176.1 DUF58 domain-containing protein [Demequina sp. SYSU T00068]